MTRQRIVWTRSLMLNQSSGLILSLFPAAPPDYNSVVTQEEAEQRNNMVAPQLTEDLSGILERPLMAFVQEFRFRPPPVYSEVSCQICKHPPTAGVYLVVLENLLVIIHFKTS